MSGVTQRVAEHVWLVILAPVFVGVIVGISIPLATGVWKPWHHPSATVTEVRYFDPTPTQLRPASTFAVTRTSGTCNSLSNVDAAPETARCFTANGGVFDPCWGALGSIVTCVLSPWSQTATVITVASYDFLLGPPKYRAIAWNPNSDKPPPVPFYKRRGTTKLVAKTEPPWAVELTNGARCIDVSGATYSITGERANYQCSQTGSDASFLNGPLYGWGIGFPDRSQKLWRLEYLAPGSTATTPTGITTAWY